MIKKIINCLFHMNNYLKHKYTVLLLLLWTIAITSAFILLFTLLKINKERTNEYINVNTKKVRSDYIGNKKITYEMQKIKLDK